MVTKINLNAKSRDDNVQLSQLRAKGQVPAQVYGPQTKNKKIMVKRDDLNKAFALAGQSGLIDLTIDTAKTIPVIIKEMQKNPIKETFIHIDFYQVNLKKPIEVEVQLRLVGEAKAVKDLGGMISQAVDTVEVRGLPTDLVERIEVDITGLDTFEATIKMSELKLPPGLKLVSETDSVVASVLQPRLVEEEEVEATEGEETEETVGGAADEAAEGAQEPTTEEDKPAAKSGKK